MIRYEQNKRTELVFLRFLSLALAGLFIYSFCQPVQVYYLVVVGFIFCAFIHVSTFSIGDRFVSVKRYYFFGWLPLVNVKPEDFRNVRLFHKRGSADTGMSPDVGSGCLPLFI